MERSNVKDELSLFSYEILGHVGRQGAGAHDLRRLARRGRMLDWAGESQYVEHLDLVDEVERELDGPAD